MSTQSAAHVAAQLRNRSPGAGIRVEPQATGLHVHLRAAGGSTVQASIGDGPSVRAQIADGHTATLRAPSPTGGNGGSVGAPALFAVDMGTLHGQVALVTGSSRGIGAAIAAVGSKANGVPSMS